MDDLKKESQKKKNRDLKDSKKEKIPTVTIPLKKSATQSVITVKCPHCGYPRRVEPDANYTVTCEECGKKYHVGSVI